MGFVRSGKGKFAKPCYASTALVVYLDKPKLAVAEHGVEIVIAEKPTKEDVLHLLAMGRRHDS